MRSDLLALPASRLGDGLKLSFACNALTRRSLAPSMVALTDRPSQVIGQSNRQTLPQRAGVCFQCFVLPHCLIVPTLPHCAEKLSR
jgi:hypothetical protein